MRLWFRVIEVSERMSWKEGQPSVFSVKLRPLQSESNRRWLAAIPDKPIELQVLTAEAAATFRPGAEMLVDFTPAPAPSGAAAPVAGADTAVRPAPSDPDEIC